MLRLIEQIEGSVNQYTKGWC